MAPPPAPPLPHQCPHQSLLSSPPRPCPVHPPLRVLASSLWPRFYTTWYTIVCTRSFCRVLLCSVFVCSLCSCLPVFYTSLVLGGAGAWGAGGGLSTKISTINNNETTAVVFYTKSTEEGLQLFTTINFCYCLHCFCATTTIAATTTSTTVSQSVLLVHALLYGNYNINC